MLDFLYTAVSWVLLRWHQLFTALGINPDSGLNWSLSIIFLVVTARLLLVRLFIKQVHYQRKMQQMQPQIKKLQEKHKGDRQTLQQEMMKLQQEEGFNPLSGCLPMFLQLPVFLGLYHVLRHIADSVDLANKVQSGQTLTASEAHSLTLYGFTQAETVSAAQAKLFGAPLASSFHDSNALITQLGGDPTTTRWVIGVLLVISAAATLGTQLLVRHSQPVPPEGMAALLQRLMIFAIPIGVVGSGLLFNFPLGVLLYWFASNLWTLGQQGYIMRFHPHPDTVSSGAVVANEVGRSRAPKPGARPTRDARGRVVTVGDAADDGAESEPGTAPADDAPADDASAAPASAPRPGQKPNRSSNRGANRPPGKRPSQRKKRR